MAWTLADRFLCVSATPFGADVEPDVNWTNAMSLSDGRLSGSSGGASSASHDSTRVRSGQLARSPLNVGTSALVVTTARAPAARRMPAVRSKYLDRSLVVAGGYRDAGMTPATDAPKSVVR